MPTTQTGTNNQATLRRIVETITSGRRFVISSHARPDGDSIGSQMAMSFALQTLGKEVVVVNKDLAPGPLRAFPGVPTIQISNRVDEEFDAAVVMECGDLGRTGVAGLDRFFIINIDHHPDNTGYGQINWFDPTAAACGEMVYTLIRELGVPLTLEIATHIYLAILTDTGSFHYSAVTSRTFDICSDLLRAGVKPSLTARAVYDNDNLAKMKLFGSVLSGVKLDETGRIAIVYIDHEMARAAGGTYEDTEGIINLPLSVKDIQAVVFFKQNEGDQYRVSMRSKGEIDVNAVAKEFGGGGHKNAAGCTADGSIDRLQKIFVEKIRQAIESQDRSVAGSEEGVNGGSHSVTALS